MSYSQDIKQQKPIFTTVASTTALSGSTPEIDLEGGTLAGVLLESDITSTTFTITVSRKSGGTFVTVKDALGTYGTAGNALTFTIGATATGFFFIPPWVTEGFRFCKIALGSSEAQTFYISKRNLQ